MLDVIVVAMVLVLFVLSWSVFSVKYRRQYRRHKVIQLWLAGALLVLLVFFEIDIQFVENWKQRALASPYYATATGRGLVVYSLWIHLVFATTTLALWLWVILRALNQFPIPPAPNGHSAYHSRWGMIAAIDMFLTAVSGWAFYFLAFVA
jgi:uncharacterized membrane protein YozB (DUF420 family)